MSAWAIPLCAVVAVTVVIGVWAWIPRRKRPYPYDWQRDGECGPQKSHVRILR